MTEMGCENTERAARQDQMKYPGPRNKSEQINKSGQNNQSEQYQSEQNQSELIDHQIDQGLILAAGRGTRLKELTANHPKALVEVAGRPLLEWILRGFRQVGISRVVIVIGYQGEKIIDRYQSGTELGLDIEYQEQDLESYGTGAAVKQSRESLKPEPFLCTYGDILTSPDNYRCLIETYREQQSMVLLLSWLEKISQGGLAHHREEADRLIIEKIEEKPDLDGGGWNNAGVYLLTPEIFDWLEEINRSPREEYELPTAFNLMLAASIEMVGCKARGYWFDIGRQEDLKRAEETIGRYRVP